MVHILAASRQAHTEGLQLLQNARHVVLARINALIVDVCAAVLAAASKQGSIAATSVCLGESRASPCAHANAHHQLQGHSSSQQGGGLLGGAFLREVACSSEALPDNSPGPTSVQPEEVPSQPSVALQLLRAAHELKPVLELCFGPQHLDLAKLLLDMQVRVVALGIVLLYDWRIYPQLFHAPEIPYVLMVNVTLAVTQCQGLTNFSRSVGTQHALHNQEEVHEKSTLPG